MKQGLLFFYQSWTDLVNHLSMIDYYLSKYDHITVILRPEAKPIFEFYLKNKNNITKIYDPLATTKVSKDFYNKFDANIYDYLLHGKLDANRNDQYKNAFISSSPSIHFNKKYYICYGIDYINKINFFNIERDFNKENIFYEKFIAEHGSNYVLYHDNHLGDSAINFKKHESTQYIDLNGNALDMFNMIKILEHAKEMHFVDSVWASFCYILDARYGIFKNIKIYIYPFVRKERWGGLLKDTYYKHELKLEPMSLDNWTIVV
jgi:hypothetical protein